MDKEQEITSELAPWTQKIKYSPVFEVPPDPWKIDASWDDAYF
jgi:hypothetical protein